MKKKLVITAVAAVTLAATVGVTTHVKPFLASEVDLDVSDDSVVPEGDVDFEDTGNGDVDLSGDLTLDEDSEVTGDEDFDNADTGGDAGDVTDGTGDSTGGDSVDNTKENPVEGSGEDFTEEDFAGDFEDVDLDGEFGDETIDDEFGDFDVDFDDKKDTTKKDKDKDKDKKNKEKADSNSGKKKKNEPTVVTSNQADGGDPAGKGTKSSGSSSASLPKTGKSSPFDVVTNWIYSVLHSILN